MTYVIKFLAFALFLFVPSFCEAQIVDSSEVIARLTEVVVQATRITSKSPVPHSNLKAAQIAQRLQAQDIPMLLSATPSLVESSDAGTGIGYTGLRIRGSDPTRVNVTINGVPINDAESQGVYWVDLPDLAASAAEIQVQRGVGASSNGAGAFGATVNIDLSRVMPDPGATVSSTIGAFGTRKFSGQVHTGLLSENWSFTGRTTLIQSDGYIDRSSADLNSLHLSAAYLGDRQSLQVHLLSGHEITYQAWNGVPAQFIDDEKLRTYNSAGMEQPETPYSNEVDDYAQQHLLLHYKRILTPQIILQLNGHYTKGKGYYEQYKANEPYADYGLAPQPIADTLISSTDLVRRRWLDNDYYGGTFALRWNPVQDKSTEILLGGAISRYSGRHFGEIIWSSQAIGQPKDYRYYDNTADKHDANIYLKAEMAFSKRATGFVDLQTRAIHYSFKGFDNDLNPTDQAVEHFFFNPKFGTTYSLSNRWVAYAYFGIAQREPNRDDYTQSSPNSRPKPEQMADTELGLRFEGAKSAASINFFLMQYRNQLALDGRINDVGAYIRTNVPRSFRAGIELEANTAVGQRIMLSGNLAVSQNKIKSFTEFRDDWDTGLQIAVAHQNSDLAFSPEIVARGELIGILWSKPAKNKVGKRLVSAAISGKYVGQQYLDNSSNAPTALPGYFVSDLRLNVDCKNLFGKQLSLILSLNNWLDACYSSNGWIYRYYSAGYDARADDPYTRLESGNAYQQVGYFPQAGRHWMATFRVGF